MKAFTYLIINKLNNRWYYGVRYARGCDPSDMLIKYYSSSEKLKSDISKFGVSNFYCEIRKTFDDIEKALAWESKVLKRMKVITNNQSYNLHDARSFSPKFGEDNVSKSINTIDKMKRTKTKQNLIKLFKRKIFPVERRKLSVYLKYLDILKEQKPNCKLMIDKLADLIYQISLIKNKEYPKNRKSGVRGNCSKISESKRNKVWYTSPDLTKAVVLSKDAPAPIGWIRGNKLKSRNEKISQSSKDRIYDEKFRLAISRASKNKKYFTSPDGTQLRAFKDESDAPIGWIRGNKLKSRNEKISKYLKEVRHVKD